MLVEFPQCPEWNCENGMIRCGLCKEVHHSVPPFIGCVGGGSCSRCDALGVLIPDEMVEAVAKGFWNADDTYVEQWHHADEDARGWYRRMARAGLAALVRYQHAQVDTR